MLTHCPTESTGCMWPGNGTPTNKQAQPGTEHYAKGSGAHGVIATSLEDLIPDLAGNSDYDQYVTYICSPLLHTTYVHGVLCLHIHACGILGAGIPLVLSAATVTLLCKLHFCMLAHSLQCVCAHEGACATMWFANTSQHLTGACG